MNAAVVWFSTIATLFGRWSLDVFPKLDPNTGPVQYIFDVGASYRHGFILGTSFTSAFYSLTLLFTKLSYDTENQPRFKRVISYGFIVCGLVAAASLIILSILDSPKHTTYHYVFVGLFIMFTLFSTLFNIAYRFTRNRLNAVLVTRLIFICVIIPLIITYIVLVAVKTQKNGTTLKSVAASIEWSIALLYVYYLSLFGIEFVFYDS